MKKSLKVLIFLLFVQILFSVFCSCNLSKKSRYDMSVQVENKSGFDYDVSIDYKGKNHSSMSLHDGFVVASFLGEFNILDSDIEKVANDVQITISELNGNVSLQKTFSYADGFVIKYDLKRVPKMLRRNHIELSLALIKNESGEISLVVSDENDE